MSSESVASKRHALFKVKGPGWKQVVRTQKLRRAEAARGKQIGSRRQAVIQSIQLEEDLQLERDMLQEQLELEYDHLFTEYDEPLHPCPICSQELPTTQNFRQCLVECKTCDFSTQLVWDDFQRALSSAHGRHSKRGCTDYAEIVSLDGELFIACEVCDYLEAAL